MTFQFWRRWLMVVTGGVMLYSLGLMLLPETMQALFKRLFFDFGDASFNTEAQDYIQLVQGVLGAVIIGWMVTFLAIIVWFFQPGQARAWDILALSMTIWFLMDSGFSVAIGVVNHAIFNVIFLVLFVLPLGATYRQMRG